MSTEIPSSPFLRSPSCKSFKEAFHISPEQAGASIYRPHAPRPSRDSTFLGNAFYAKSANCINLN